MTDLTGIAHQLHLSVEQIRIAAGLLEQGYQPAFISQYRADETGCLSRSDLWALKLEIDRQQRLATARVRLTNQLPKDTEVDEEATTFIKNSKTELDVEVALRTFRARRALAISQEDESQAGKLLELLLAHNAEISDVPAWAAEQLGVDVATATAVSEQTKKLIASLLSCDTELAAKLRSVIQRKAKLRVEMCDNAPDDDEKPATAPQKAAPAPEAAPPGEAVAEEASSVQAVDSEPKSDSDPVVETQPTNDVETLDAASASDDSVEDVAAKLASAPTDVVPPPIDSEGGSPSLPNTATDASEAAPTTAPMDASAAASDATATETTATETAESPSDEPGSESPDEILSKRFGESKKERKKTKTVKAASVRAKSAAKLTPRQRRRRWLIAMLTPMKSLSKPLTKLTAYQQLMLGRGRRSQILKTNLEYDQKSLIPIARDRFVNREHPLSKWFSSAVAEALDSGLRSKVEGDAVAELEELASEKLLTTSAEGLRKTLMQRPVRGHRIMVVDTVGPKVAAVAIVDQSGNVLATDEIPCSALAETVTQNVTRLGELAHKYRVTLLALTNGPARRFLVHTLRELVTQSAGAGLRWTMADRSGADAYAAGRTALRELSAFNRRDRAAIWVARSLQDPLTQYLKVGINRLRLGSYQRELPQEPLKKLVRETIADCVATRGVDVHSASVAQLLCVPGVTDEQAQQIATLAARGALESREQMLASVQGWTETQSRQAIGMLRVFGSPQPLDATSIHPEDYRLAMRLIENTELEAPPAAPEGWSKPTPMELDFAAEAADATGDDDTDSDHDAEATSAASTETHASVAASDVSSESENLSAASEGTTTEASREESAQASSAETPADEKADDTVSGDLAAEEANSESDSSQEAGASGAEPSGEGSEGPGDSVGSTMEAAVTTTGDVAAQQSSAPAPEYPEDVEAAKPKPLPIDVEKLARGWQVGREKLRSIATSLNEPFADGRLAGSPVPLAKEMPTLANLRPGMSLWAVVVGVADFGAFVELGPECSGLIHISRLSNRYVEDPHEFVQVGDLIMTWVVSVDEKKGRVALTALSPDQRAAAPPQGRPGGQRDGQSSQGQQRGGQRPAGQQRGAAAAGGRPQGSRGPGQGGRTGGEGRGSGGQPKRSGAPGRGQGGGKGFGGDRRGGSRGHGGGRSSQPVVVKSKKPIAPISSAMKEGEEPLRSFGDLMQFYEAKRTDEPTTKLASKSSSQAVAPEPAAAAQVEAATADSAEKAGAVEVGVASQGAASQPESTPASDSDQATSSMPDETHPDAAQ